MLFAETSFLMNQTDQMTATIGNAMEFLAIGLVVMAAIVIIIIILRARGSI